MKQRTAILLATWLALPLLVFGQQSVQAVKPTGEAKETAEPERKTRVRLGGITVGAGYTHYSGPGYYYGYPYPYAYPYWHHPWYWNPVWAPYAPYYHPGFFTGLVRGDDMGEVKLAVEPKQAEVLLDGAYAGTAAGLKSMWLAPGAYDVALKAPDRAPYQRRIYVLTGKTLRISATLATGGAEPKP